MPITPDNPSTQDAGNQGQTAPIPLTKEFDPKAHPLYNDSVLLHEIAKRADKGANLLAQEWKEVVEKDPTNRAKFDKIMGLLLNLHASYFHMGGTGCINASVSAHECDPEWSPVPLCWSCAKGSGLPPIEVGFLTSKAFEETVNDAHIFHAQSQASGMISGQGEPPTPSQDAPIQMEQADQTCDHKNKTELPTATQEMTKFTHLCHDCGKWIRVKVFEPPIEVELDEDELNDEEIAKAVAVHIAVNDIKLNKTAELPTNDDDYVILQVKTIGVIAADASAPAIEISIPGGSPANMTVGAIKQCVVNAYHVDLTKYDVDVAVVAEDVVGKYLLWTATYTEDDLADFVVPQMANLLPVFDPDKVIWNVKVITVTAVESGLEPTIVYDNIIQNMTVSDIMKAVTAKCFDLADEYDLEIIVYHTDSEGSMVLATSFVTQEDLEEYVDEIPWSKRLGVEPFTSCTREGCTVDVIHVHISSVGHCRREVAYGLLGIEESNPGKPHWKRAAELSNHSEAIMVDALFNRGFMIADAVDDQVEVHFYSEETGMLYVGHPDGDVIGRNGETTETANLELKCPRDQYFQAIKDQGVANVRPEYLAQMHGYMTAKEQNQSYLSVMSRDQGLMTIEIVDYDPAYWQKLDTGWGAVKNDLAQNVLPNPDYTGNGYQCLVCAFHDLCPAWIAAHQSK